MARAEVPAKMQDATRFFPLTRMCPGIATNVCMHVFVCVCVCVCVCVSLCVHVRAHSHACTRTHRPFRGWITEELLSPSRLPPAGGTRALFLVLSLSHSLSLILSLARSFSRMLSLSIALSFSLVCVCLSLSHMLEYGEQYALEYGEHYTRSTRCCE